MRSMNQPHFAGSTYNPTLDQDRLSSQYNRVFDVMCDGGWHTLKTLAVISGGSEAAISARIRDMRKERFGGHEVNRRRVPGKRGLWEYQLVLRKDLLV